MRLLSPSASRPTSTLLKQAAGAWQRPQRRTSLLHFHLTRFERNIGLDARGLRAVPHNDFVCVARLEPQQAGSSDT